MRKKIKINAAANYRVFFKIVPALLLCLSVALTGCGGSNSTQPNTIPTASAFTVASIGNAAKSVDWKILSAAQDANGDALTATVKSQPSLAVFSIFADTLTITPAANQEGNDSGVLTISDGNGGSVDVTVTIQGIDTLSPVVPVVTVVALTNNPKPAFLWSAVTGAATYQVSIDGGSWIDVGSAVTYTPASNFSDGAHTLSCRAVDSAGNIGTASGNATVTIDTVSPNVPVVTVVALTSNPKPAFLWNAVDSAATYQVSIDGGSWIDVDSSVTYTPASSFSDGSHTLSCRAVDSAGNVGTASGNATVTIDTLPPDVPVITVVAISNIQNPTWSWNAVDGAVSYDISNNSGASYVNIGNVTHFTPGVNLSDGTYKLRCRAHDAVGNIGAPSADVTTIIDTVAPSYNNVGLNAGAGTSTFIFSEAIQSVSAVSLYLFPQDTPVVGNTSVTGVGTNTLHVNFDTSSLHGSNLILKLLVADAAGNSRLVTSDPFTP